MSLLGHVAIGVVVARATSRPDDPPDRLPSGMLALGALSLLPDTDLILNAIAPDVPLFQHRGPSHSLFFALLVGLAVGLLLGLARHPSAVRWAVLAGVIVASHGLIDSIGQSPLGVELFWPFSDARVLAPWHILPNPSLDPPLSVNLWGEIFLELLLFAPAWVYAFFPRWILERGATDE